MRVLHVLNELKPSGAEVMLKVAARVWQEEGLELGIIATEQEVGIFAGSLEEAGYEVIHIPFVKRRSFLNWSKCKAAVSQLKQFEVIHIHTERKAALFAILAKLAGCRKIVRTVHSNFSINFRTRIRLTVERFWARLLGVHHVAISETVRDNEWDQFRNTSTVILNWIDTDHYRPPTAGEREAARARLRVDQDTKLIVSVGNGSDIKNYRSIIQAIAHLEDPSLRYYQVGMEHPGLVDRSLAESLGLGEQVKFIGPVDDPSLYLWACDLYIMPSFYEGFGLAAIEALACGLPAVFSRVKGLSDWSSDEYEIYWSGVDFKSVANAIQQWKERHSIEQDKVDRTSGIKKYSPLRGASKYSELYRAIH